MRMLRVKVRPRSRAHELEELSDGTWLARVKSVPVDGKANQELVQLIAGHFGVRRSRVSVKSGASARVKLVCIDD